MVNALTLTTIGDAPCVMCNTASMCPADPAGFSARLPVDPVH